MKKVRIGNDIAIEWSIYRLGEGEVFHDKEVAVKILDPCMKPIPFEYKIEDNKIIGVFEGRNQKAVGAYTLLLLENCGELHMNTLDECNFVQLVPHSYMEGGKDESSITTEKIELSTDIEVPSNGLDGDSAYDIWIKLGHQGTEEDFIAWLQQPAINAANEAHEQMAQFAEKEAERDNAELERVANEETRQENEQERIRVENVRQEAEVRRKENDRIMREHETERIKAEDQRVLAEQKRNLNEDVRQSQESTRESNENQRIKNEAKRKSVVRTSKLKTDGLVDTYIIVYSDGSFDTFTVTNGRKGDKGEIGTQGVYVGEEEPTGDVKFWIDPNGVPTDVGITLNDVKQMLADPNGINDNARDWYAKYLQLIADGDGGLYFQDEQGKYHANIIYLTNEECLRIVITDGEDTKTFDFSTKGLNISGGYISGLNSLSGLSENVYDFALSVRDALKWFSLNSDISGELSRKAFVVTNPESGNEIARFEGVDDNTLSISGDFGDVRVQGLATPTSNNDAVNKKYVDDAINDATKSYVEGSTLVLTGKSVSVNNNTLIL